MNQKARLANEEDLLLLLREENYLAAFTYHEIIRKILDEKKKLPLWVFEKFTSFFEIEQTPKSNSYHETPEFQATIERFSSKKYLEKQPKLDPFADKPVPNSGFVWTVELPGPEFFKYEPIIRYVFRNIDIEYLKSKACTKGDCVRTIHLCIEDFANINYSNVQHNSLSFSARAIIATFISIQLGKSFTELKPKNGKWYSNYELSKMSRNESYKLSKTEVRFHPKARLKFSLKS